MRHIKGELTQRQRRFVRGKDVAHAQPVRLTSFHDLVREVAELAYVNKDHLLFFRGQGHDYWNKANASSLYPSIYRGERVPREQLELRWDVLTAASRQLCDTLERGGVRTHRDVRRRRYVQWSILQHYEVCPTPLMDFTQSLRVACSFAFLANRTDPLVFVVGLPYVANRVSVNSEHDIVNVRLLSICPPEALRPHFQQGFLAATDEITTDFISKNELDFNNRLLAKYQLGDAKRFWQGGFKPVSKRVLYPTADPMLPLCKDLREHLSTGVEPGRLGGFLQEWTRLESTLVNAARQTTPSGSHGVSSVRRAIDALTRAKRIPVRLGFELHELRKLRNDIVHRPDQVAPQRIARAMEELAAIHRTLELARI